MSSLLLLLGSALVGGAQSQFSAVMSLESASQAGAVFSSKEVPPSLPNGCLNGTETETVYYQRFSDSNLGDGLNYPKLCPKNRFKDGNGKVTTGYFARQTNACKWTAGQSNLQYARLQNWCKGLVRAFHWHDDADEWAYVEKGHFTVWVTSPTGLPWQVAVNEVHAGGVWYFPRNWPHSILCNSPEKPDGTGGCSAVLIFAAANGATTGGHPLDVTLGQAAAPQGFDEVAAQAMGVSVHEYRKIWKPRFPGAGLNQGEEGFKAPQVAMAPEGTCDPECPKVKNTEVFPAAVERSVEQKVSLASGVDVYQIRTQQFPFATTMSQERVVLPRGKFRQLLWVTNADGLMFVTKGSVTVQVQGGFAGAQSPSADFSKTAFTHRLRKGDIFYFPVGRAYWIKEATNLLCAEVITVFNVGSWHSVEVEEQLRHFPKFTIAGSLNHGPENDNEFDKQRCEFNTRCEKEPDKWPSTGICCPKDGVLEPCCDDYEGKVVPFPEAFVATGGGSLRGARRHAQEGQAEEKKGEEDHDETSQLQASLHQAHARAGGEDLPREIAKPDL